MTLRRAILIAAVLAFTSPTWAGSDWQDSTLVNVRTVNEWCRHCPDANQTFYSFKLADGMVYVAHTHRTLDLALNGHAKIRFEKNGHVGDTLHVLDDAGKDRKLKITERIAP
jgi:hypothetical protein